MNFVLVAESTQTDPTTNHPSYLIIKFSLFPTHDNEDRGSLVLYSCSRKYFFSKTLHLKIMFHLQITIQSTIPKVSGFEQQ